MLRPLIAGPFSSPCRPVVEAAPSYPTRIAFRLKPRTGLRVSEALVLPHVGLCLHQNPPVIVVRRADSQGNEARKILVPADLSPKLYLVSFHN